MELSLKQLEDEIRNLICSVTNYKYISQLDVKYQDGIYTLKIGLDGKEVSRISLGYQGDDFLGFLENEFRKRQLQGVKSNKSTLLSGGAPIYPPVIEL